MQAAVPPRTSIAERTRARVDRRLMPFLFACYIVANLDRANVGFAALRMSRELGFSDRIFGLGGGIFFLGYFLLEIPGTVLVEVWSARKWIARIMLTWGFLASATGWIHSPAHFYWIRFFLQGRGHVHGGHSGRADRRRAIGGPAPASPLVGL